MTTPNAPLPASLAAAPVDLPTRDGAWCPVEWPDKATRAADDRRSLPAATEPCVWPTVKP